MVIDMNEAQVRTIEQVRQMLADIPRNYGSISSRATSATTNHQQANAVSDLHAVQTSNQVNTSPGNHFGCALSWVIHNPAAFRVHSPPTA